MSRRQFALALTATVISAFLGGFAAEWFFSGAASAQTLEMVAAKELRLVDDDGRTRALLSLLRGKPRLIMTDDRGEFRIEFGLGEAGEPNFWLRDHNGRARARIKLSAAGSPSLIMSDENGRDRLALWQEKGELGLALADPKGGPRAGLALKGGDKASLAFYDQDRKVIWFAPKD